MDEEGSTDSQEDTVKLKEESKFMEEAIEVGIQKASDTFNSVSWRDSISICPNGQRKIPNQWTPKASSKRANYSIKNQKSRGWLLQMEQGISRVLWMFRDQTLHEWRKTVSIDARDPVRHAGRRQWREVH